ncbi:MAG: choloylglycine hydrolase family protein [Pseudomonadota bacterium]
MSYFKMLQCVVVLLLMVSTAWACTGLRVIAEDGAVVVGRTMEFGFDVQSDAAVVPVGTQLTSSLTDSRASFSYRVEHGFVGANAMGRRVVADGVNERGLYVGAHYFPGYAGYVELTDENADRALAPEDYATWLLAGFASVEEVRAHFADVVLVGNPIEEIGGIAAPLHFVVHDASGASIVIEPVDGELTLHENPLGVFTNSPGFDWHMTNLNNYMNLTATNVPQFELGNAVWLQQFGQGTGMRGLPGDFTPPSRFVRAVAYSQSAETLATAEPTVKQVFHIMNAFDIPRGAVQDVHDDGVHLDYTVWTSVADLQNRRWLFRTYNDQTIRSIDVREALAAAGDQIRLIEMDSAQPIDDVSTRFTP